MTYSGLAGLVGGLDQGLQRGLAIRAAQRQRSAAEAQAQRQQRRDDNERAKNLINHLPDFIRRVNGLEQGNTTQKQAAKALWKRFQATHGQFMIERGWTDETQIEFTARQLGGNPGALSRIAKSMARGEYGFITGMDELSKVGADPFAMTKIMDLINKRKTGENLALDRLNKVRRNTRAQYPRVFNWTAKRMFPDTEIHELNDEQVKEVWENTDLQEAFDELSPGVKRELVRNKKFKHNWKPSDLESAIEAADNRSSLKAQAEADARAFGGASGKARFDASPEGRAAANRAAAQAGIVSQSAAEGALRAKDSGLARDLRAEDEEREVRIAVRISQGKLSLKLGKLGEELRNIELTQDKRRALMQAGIRISTDNTIKNNDLKRYFSSFATRVREAKNDDDLARLAREADSQVEVSLRVAKGKLQLQLSKDADRLRSIKDLNAKKAYAAKLEADLQHRKDYQTNDLLLKQSELYKLIQEAESNAEIEQLIKRSDIEVDKAERIEEARVQVQLGENATKLRELKSLAAKRAYAAKLAADLDHHEDIKTSDLLRQQSALYKQIAAAKSDAELDLTLQKGLIKLGLVSDTAAEKSRGERRSYLDQTMSGRDQNLVPTYVAKIKRQTGAIPTNRQALEAGINVGEGMSDSERKLILARRTGTFETIHLTNKLIERIARNGDGFRGLGAGVASFVSNFSADVRGLAARLDGTAKEYIDLQLVHQEVMNGISTDPSMIAIFNEYKIYDTNIQILATQTAFALATAAGLQGRAVTASILKERFLPQVARHIKDPQAAVQVLRETAQTVAERYNIFSTQNLGVAVPAFQFKIHSGVADIEGRNKSAEQEDKELNDLSTQFQRWYQESGR